jgi:hypothetical protein
MMLPKLRYIRFPCLDVLAIGVSKRTVHPMLLETIGDSATHITVLQLTVSFVIHAHCVLPVLFLNGSVKRCGHWVMTPNEN